MMRDRIRKYWQSSKNHPDQQALWAHLFNMLGRNQFGLAGDRNTLEFKGAILQNLRIDLWGDDNEIKVGAGTRLSNLLIRVRGDHHRIIIGENCTYQAGEIWVEDHHTVLEIGAGTTIVKAHFAVTEPGSQVVVGPQCMFAHDIELRCGDSHSIIDLQTSKRINYAQNIRLGQHVWVAAGVTILKGVELGNDCVVASRALVTHSFPANCLIGGVPAELLRQQITWQRERIYETH